MKEHNVLGVILAGGKSSRFGSNKSLSKLANNKLIEHVINKIDSYFPKILIVSNDSNLKIENKKIKIIKDCIEGYLGPLVGVLSAMKYANSYKNKYKWIITFPCDTPFFNSIIIKKMFEKINLAEEKIYFIKEKKQRHNIFGMWSTKWNIGCFCWNSIIWSKHDLHGTNSSICSNNDGNFSYICVVFKKENLIINF